MDITADVDVSDAQGDQPPGKMSPAWYTGAPSTTVASTPMSVIRSGGTSSGLASSTVKSASFPASSDPISSSRRAANAACVVYRDSASQAVSSSPGPNGRPASVRRSTASRMPSRGSAVMTGASDEPATVMPARRQDAYAYSSSARSPNAAANPSPSTDSIPGWAATMMPSAAARAASGGYSEPPCSIRCRNGLPAKQTAAYASSTVSMARSPWAWMQTWKPSASNERTISVSSSSEKYKMPEPYGGTG